MDKTRCYALEITNIASVRNFHACSTFGKFEVNVVW